MKLKNIYTIVSKINIKTTYAREYAANAFCNEVVACKSNGQEWMLGNTSEWKSVGKCNQIWNKQIAAVKNT